MTEKTGEWRLLLNHSEISKYTDLGQQNVHLVTLCTTLKPSVLTEPCLEQTVLTTPSDALLGQHCPAGRTAAYWYQRPGWFVRASSNDDIDWNHMEGERKAASTGTKTFWITFNFCCTKNVMCVFDSRLNSFSKSPTHLSLKLEKLELKLENTDTTDRWKNRVC